jgi:hypothetical protein
VPIRVACGLYAIGTSYRCSVILGDREWERCSGTRVSFIALLELPVLLIASFRWWVRSLALDSFVDPVALVTVDALSLEVVLADLFADISLCNQR